MIGQDNLQVANSRFFQVIATSVAVKAGASIVRHANDVAGFVQQGMYWRVAAYVDAATDDARFRITPETASY